MAQTMAQPNPQDIFVEVLYAFGAEEDQRGYMSRYGFEESIRDGATLPLHFEPRLVGLHIDKEAIDQAYGELSGAYRDR